MKVHWTTMNEVENCPFRQNGGLNELANESEIMK